MIKNGLAKHPLQSYEWGQFREKTGIKVIRENSIQLTIHKIPKTPWTIGYFPKGDLPDKKMLETLRNIGKREKCIFIQIEPNIKKISNLKFQISNLGLKPSAHPLFTKYTFQLDLTKSEEELLANMHPKTRYNIRVAQKHGVQVIEDNSDKAFKEYLRLTQETTKRQAFYAHTQRYHELMWQTLKRETKNKKLTTDELTAHLLLAKYKNKTLAAWVLFIFKDTLYYPYGASSTENKETMASNLIMWEAIKYGKKLGLKKFDMWGALGNEPDKNNPWFGFHRFKQGYGPELVEFIGSYDLVINPVIYQIYKLADKVRWTVLKLKR